MSLMQWLTSVLAFLAGALISIQAGSNTQLKKALGDPMPATVVNYLLGVASVLLYSVATRVSIPTFEQVSRAPWWSWLGGLFGVAYGLAAVMLGSQMGAATLMALVVTGQLVCSVVLDHFGWVGFDPHPAGVARLIGCVLMVAGLALIAKF
jgi:bacterial/archaeal transporter family-2 protein